MDYEELLREYRHQRYGIAADTCMWNIADHIPALIERVDYLEKKNGELTEEIELLEEETGSELA